MQEAVIEAPKRPLLDYYGGKWKYASKIIGLIPPHKTFVDVMCGAASITLRKDPSKNEIINDIHSEIFNLFKILRECPGDLKKALESTPYSRDEYYHCRQPSFIPLEQARRTIVKSWFGIGDSMDNKTGFRVSLSQGGSTTSPWIKYVDCLHLYTNRLRQVIVENLPYQEILKRYDKADTVFYIDPPYLMSIRSKKHSYLHDWSESDHLELIETVKALESKVILSGYDHAIYKNLNFNKIQFEAETNGSSRTETVWFNFEREICKEG